MDADRLARVPFGAAWLAAGEPTADVMDVRSRMAMYRSLVERTMAARRELNPFWGYASQLAWQHRSGRLGGSEQHAIAASSWWGACNYALSVVPYVAAMHQALVPRLPIAAAPGYASVLPRWYEALRVLRTAEDLDRVRLAIWDAHLASITLAVRLHDREYRALPPAEQRFARGWIRMVDLFAAAAVRTDLDKLVETGGGALPSRVLADELVDDLPRYERSTVRRVGALADRPAWRWHLELRAWRRIMRTRPARADAERLLAGLLGAGKDMWPSRLRALAYATVPSSLLERGSSDGGRHPRD